ncbi:hypothetical protein RRG08_008241 [Elysia crispata]|uniref:Uncharacterized protein n=1 Tax=Elysia crispata TaxID=231223 RepID=A0AAE0YBB9_9GAST|nr:hypothetical protein RRG08_008241 [Elysia crispata]
MSKQDVLFKQMAVRVLMAEIDLRNVYEYGQKDGIEVSQPNVELSFGTRPRYSEGMIKRFIRLTELKNTHSRITFKSHTIHRSLDKLMAQELSCETRATQRERTH